MELFDEVQLSNDRLNALLDIRFSAEAGGFFDGERYPPERLRALEREGLVEHEAGARWWLTEKGRTCHVRNGDMTHDRLRR